MFEALLSSIIQLMVAIDVPGVLPIYMGVTAEMQTQDKKKIARQSVFTALIITVLFALLGSVVFNALDIRVADFMIAGGILLLVISITDLVRAGDRGISVLPTFGVVPLGTPLLAGPAALTTTLVLVGRFGYIPVFISLIVNLLLAWLIFDRAQAIMKFIGVNGARAITKIASLLLAAIAIKLIRMGVAEIIMSYR